MKRGYQKLRRGYTLIELSVVMLLGLAASAIVMTLFNQQLAFLRIFAAQNFLTDEAPLVSTYIRRVVGKAERFRLHDSVADALSGTNPRLTSSPVCVLNFRQPDGSMRASILAFQDLGDGPALYYYVVPESGVMNAPQWTVTSQPTNVEFYMEQGILRTKLTGPEGEEIIYSGAMQ